MEEEILKRLPFIVLDISEFATAPNGSLLFDETTNELFLKDLSGNSKKVHEVAIRELLDLLYIDLKDGVSSEGDTLLKLANRIQILRDWSYDQSSVLGNVIDTVSKLINAMKGIFNINSELEKLVDVEPGKILSSNDFTNELKAKLDSIDPDANYYIHPVTKHCHYQSPLKSVNGHTGNVTLTKHELGLGSVQKDANLYEHSEFKECAGGVDSVYSKIGDVESKKRYVGLPQVENFSIADIEDYEKLSDDKYVTNILCGPYIQEYIDNNLGEPLSLENKITFLTHPSNVKITIFIKGEWIETQTIVDTGDIGEYIVDKVPPGVYAYKLESTEMPDINKVGRAIVQNSDIVIEEYLIDYKVTFITIPEEVSVRVDLDGGFLIGKEFDLKTGLYGYTAYANGYRTIEGCFKLEFANKEINIELEKVFEVRITCEPPPPTATVVFNNRVYTEIVYVEEGLYEYYAFADNHTTVFDEIYIDKNTNIDIELLKLPIVDFIINPSNEYQIFLNTKHIKIDDRSFYTDPFSDYKYIVKGEEILDITGDVRVETEDVTVEINAGGPFLLTVTSEPIGDVYFSVYCYDTEVEYIEGVNTIEVPFGTYVEYLVVRRGYEMATGDILILKDEVVNVTSAQSDIIITVDAYQDNTMTWIRRLNTSFDYNNRIIVARHTIVEYLVYKTGFTAVSGEHEALETETVGATLESKSRMVKINPSVSGCSIYTRATGVERFFSERSTIIVYSGQIIEYTVYKDGFRTVAEKEVIIFEDTIINVQMELTSDAMDEYDISIISTSAFVYIGTRPVYDGYDSIGTNNASNITAKYGDIVQYMVNYSDHVQTGEHLVTDNANIPVLPVGSTITSEVTFYIDSDNYDIWVRKITSLTFTKSNTIKAFIGELVEYLVYQRGNLPLNGYHLVRGSEVINLKMRSSVRKITLFPNIGMCEYYTYSENFKDETFDSVIYARTGETLYYHVLAHRYEMHTGVYVVGEHDHVINIDMVRLNAPITIKTIGVNMTNDGKVYAAYISRMQNGTMPFIRGMDRDACVRLTGIFGENTNTLSVSTYYDTQGPLIALGYRDGTSWYDGFVIYDSISPVVNRSVFCAITKNKRIRVIGDNTITAPSGHQFIGVAAGGDSILGLTRNHTIVCGSNDTLLSNIPSNSDYAYVTAYEDIAAGLKFDGSVYIWGCIEHEMVSPLYQAIDVSCGFGFVCVLLDNGIIEVIQDTSKGTTDMNLNKPTGKVFKQVSCNGELAIAEAEDGMLYIWGKEMAIIKPDNEIFEFHTRDLDEFIKEEL